MTKLNLLARDGMVTVTFDPPLHDGMYQELYEIVCDAETQSELRQILQRFAQRMGVEVLLD